MNGRASTRLQLAATLAFAAVLTTALAAGSAILRTGPSCVPVLIASSQEKFLMLKTFAAQYNRAGRTVEGSCVSVTVQQRNSGDAERLLETRWVGQPGRPDVWSPASSAWVNLLAYKGASGVLPSQSNYQSLFQSPLVIGMPDQMAAALNYPKTRIGWAEILSLAQNPAGWGSRGKPEWGTFKLGKTNPTVSTSGLHALIGTYFAATNETLTVDRMADPQVKKFVRGVESSVVHYGRTASDFLSNLRHADDQGQALLYISAIALEEKELVDYNNGVIRDVIQSKPRVKLVPIYPREGTPFADHPYVILAWSAHKAKAAQSFYDYLQEPGNQKTVDANGFRYRNGKPGDSLSALIEPNQPTRSIQSTLLDGKVLDAMLKDWQANRKQARVLIVVDVGADQAALKQATARLAAAVSQFLPRDSVGVWTFPAPAATFTELRPVSQVTDGLETTLLAIAPFKGASNLELVVEAAINEMARTYDSSRVDAVLLVEMSPGNSRDIDLKKFLGNQPPTKFVRLFTIGPAGNPRLMDLAAWGQGVAYDPGDPGSATNLLNDVIANF